MRQWFNMMVWLEGIPPTLEVGFKSCVRCRSLLKSRYEVVAAECTLTLDVSLLDAIISIYGRFSRHGSPTAESLVTSKLGPLMKKHGPDVRYLPCVNKYPHSLREYVAKQFCEWKDDFGTVGFPGNIFDGAHDPWVVLGIIALAVWMTLLTRTWICMTRTGTVASCPPFAPPAIASLCLCSHGCLLRASGCAINSTRIVLNNVCLAGTALAWMSPTGSARTKTADSFALVLLFLLLYQRSFREKVPTFMAVAGVK
ncbi:hypothetical protein EDC04DRAFT_1540131 [Pisolithus marmoratus]|nr:hypothetical protein EDC04DRAFT_1540131 [Pisolithus marmoratus]